MTDAFFVPLADRGIVALTGDDTTEFLQGLVTNDISTASDTRAIYAALLTPQGKYLHDFFVLRLGEALCLDCDANRLEDLSRRLSRYRLRAKVDIADASDRFELFALFGKDALPHAGLSAEEGGAAPFAGGTAFVDPRDPLLGARAVLPAGEGTGKIEAAGFTPVDRQEYDILRMSLGIADGDPEIEPEKSFPMEYGLDELHGISFTKGCYVGQEVTVRMKTRGLVRKNLVSVKIDGAAPAAGAELRMGDTVAGELRAACGATGIALVRTEALAKARAEGVPFEAGSSRLYPQASAARSG